MANTGSRCMRYLTLFMMGFALALGAVTIGTSQSSMAAAIIETGTDDLRVEENRSLIIKLDREAASVFVANPSVADVQVKSARLLYVFGVQAGVTTFYAVDKNDEIIYSATIEVDFNIDRIQKMINELIPKATIKVQNMNAILVLTGFARTPEESELATQLVQQIFVNQRDGDEEGDKPQLFIINRIQVAMPTQVNLRVKIAEMSREIMKTLGFNWDVGLSAGGSFFGFAQGSDFVDILFDENNVPIRRQFLRTGDTNSAVFSNIGGKHDVNALVDALEDEGFLSILAEPNLTALSGETASFLAGGEFPIPVPQGGNSDSITVVFKEFGVGLAFTPTVLSENKINLKVAPEVSQLSAVGAVTINDISVPALTTRRVNTTVELGSGQSFAIAGLLQSNITQEASKYPILGDIPILGTLFRSDTFIREESELVIIVTPYIVRPVNPDQLISPTDINHMPQDTGRWIKGKRDLAGEGGLTTGEGG